MPNEIASLETVEVDGPDGPATAIMIAVNLTEPGQLKPFVTEVAEKIKVQRMISPPGTSMLLLTLIGPAESRDFEAAWRIIVSTDQVLAAFLDRMTVAEGILGTRKGEILAEFPLR